MRAARLTACVLLLAGAALLASPLIVALPAVPQFAALLPSMPPIAVKLLAAPLLTDLAKLRPMLLAADAAALGAAVPGGAVAFGLWRAGAGGRAMLGVLLLACLLAGLFLPGRLAAAALGLPFGALAGAASLARADPRILRAAASSGAPPRVIARSIVWPLIAPGIGAGALLAWASLLVRDTLAGGATAHRGLLAMAPPVLALAVLALAVLTGLTARPRGG